MTLQEILDGYSWFPPRVSFLALNFFRRKEKASHYCSHTVKKNNACAYLAEKKTFQGSRRPLYPSWI